MLTVISGTNRPDSISAQVATAVCAKLEEIGEDCEFLDLVDLPSDLFKPESYAEKPKAFGPWQESILKTDGILFVVAEYNGSFPGVLKYFIDMLEFPASLVRKPVAFIGVAAGHFGASRAIDQLTAIVQYRSAHAFGRKLTIHGARSLEIDGKSLGNDEFQERFEELIEGFAVFAASLKGNH